MKNTAVDMKAYTEEYCQKNGLELALSFEMPAGYETADGMFDPESRTLYINQTALASRPEFEQMFCLFHELRHAMQYLKPDRFDARLVKSLGYVIGYDGKCFKRVDGRWKECRLEGTEAFFTEMYLSQPSEADANAFAYRETKDLLGDSEALRNLYSLWKPEKAVAFERYEELYAAIDKCTEA